MMADEEKVSIFPPPSPSFLRWWRPTSLITLPSSIPPFCFPVVARPEPPYIISKTMMTFTRGCFDGGAATAASAAAAAVAAARKCAVDPATLCWQRSSARGTSDDLFLLEDWAHARPTFASSARGRQQRRRGGRRRVMMPMMLVKEEEKLKLMSEGETDHQQPQLKRLRCCCCCRRDDDVLLS